MSKITKTQIDNLIKEVKSSYDPKDLTKNGLHIKFVRFDVSGMTFCYKEGKNLQIEPEGVQKFDVTALTPDFIKWIAENGDTLALLHKGLSNPKAKAKKKQTISI